MSDTVDDGFKRYMEAEANRVNSPEHQEAEKEFERLNAEIDKSDQEIQECRVSLGLDKYAIQCSACQRGDPCLDNEALLKRDFIDARSEINELLDTLEACIDRLCEVSNYIGPFGKHKLMFDKLTETIIEAKKVRGYE